VRIEHEDYYEVGRPTRQNYLRESQEDGQALRGWGVAARVIVLWAETVLLVGTALICLWLFYKSGLNILPQVEKLLIGIIYCGGVFFLFWLAGRFYHSFERRNLLLEIELWKLKVEAGILVLPKEETVCNPVFETEDEADEEEETSFKQQASNNLVKKDYLLVKDFEQGTSLNKLAIKYFGKAGGFNVNKVKEVLRAYGKDL
jgi:hypothetical protein